MAVSLVATGSPVFQRQDYEYFNEQPDTLSYTISAPANSILVHIGTAFAYYTGASYVGPTNTGTALNWVFVGYSILPNNMGDPSYGFISAVFWAYNQNAQTITINTTQINNGGFSLGHQVGVFAFTGADYSVNSVDSKASSGTTRTLTSIAHPFYVGSRVTVAISDAVFDGDFNVTSVTANSFTYTGTTSATVSSVVTTGNATIHPIPTALVTAVGNYFWTNYQDYQPVVRAGSYAFVTGATFSGTIVASPQGSYTVYTPAVFGGSQFRSYIAARTVDANIFANTTTASIPNSRLGFTLVGAVGSIASQTVSPNGIASTVAFGTAQINRTVPTTGIDSTVAFGTASVSVASATQTLSPSGIASAVAFGTAQLNITVPTEGIASTNTFGTAQLNQTLTTTGIASTVAFGTASVLSSQTVTATGIDSTTTFGTAQVNLSLSATGITSTNAFGTAKLNLGISLTGIASTNAFGTALLTVFVPVTGIPSTTTLGVPQVNLGVTTVGIGSTSALGSPQLNLTIVDVGAIASAIVFGTAQVGGTVPNLVGRRSSATGSAGRTSATGATGRTTLV